MGTTTPSQSSSNPSDVPKTGWMNLINESVHTSDDIDIGDMTR